MKKVFTILAFSLFTLSTFAQNLQVHYDFGDERKMVTTTLEMFKPDKYGSTFFFVDFDYSSDSRNVENGISLGYWEIARSFKWSENQKFEPRIEFNNGGAYFGPINNAWLIGGQYTFNSADFSKILTIQANLKRIKDGKINDDFTTDNLLGFQLTAVWGLQLMSGKLSFLGFADFWRQDTYFGDKEFVFLSEPQLWYNVNENFSFGGEIELSSNFVEDGFQVNPTLAVKWTF
ncbi:DUF5020 family protein [Thermophagus sp. OGC60D27]|uniref:DUF5020 family protein n=1 Tax=Thermophagus sp. OGC60D27 TaxID=3458415 RepID=UPI0040384A59